MQINIKTSEKSQEIIRRLTAKISDRPTPENVIARIALAYSLQVGTKFNLRDADMGDNKGKEYKDHILFDSQNRDFYIALICQYYGITKMDESIPKYVKLHIDDGLDALDKIFSSSEYGFFDFLNENIEKGLRFLSHTVSVETHVRNQNQNIEKTYFSDLIKLEVGKNIVTQEPVFLSLNDGTKYNNSHVAVAGNSGTGKTQFALDLISQIHEKSGGLVNFIYLDFKGLKKDDRAAYQSFFSKTKTDFVDVPMIPFPINPLTFIDNVNNANKTMGIAKFVDIICKYYPKLGIKQKSALIDATTEAFNDQIGGAYPTIRDVNQKLSEVYNKQDSLTGILDGLCRHEVFLDDSKNTSNFINKNIYLSLSGDLPEEVRFTSLFLIVNYLYNIFMNMGNSPINGSIPSLRYVILIDEAHVLFRLKQYSDILQNMLREIRSKGVSIMLLSQGIEEYDQKEFNFSSMCEIAFLLDIKDKTNVKAMKKFLGLSDSDGRTIAQSMSKIKKGEAISNIKEFDKGKLFEVNQYWKR